MPKTQVQSDSNNSRYNPYITKSISKTLLTPCRQIGLSRKRKTPNSSGSIDNVSNIIQSNSSSDALETTPVSSRQVGGKAIKVETKTQSKLKEGQENIKRKNKISNCLIISNESQCTDSNGTVHSDSLELKEVPVVELEKEQKAKGKSKSKTVKNKTKREKCMIEDLSSTSTSKIPEKQDETSPVIFHVENATKTYSKKDKSKTLRRSLSMKKSTESYPDEEEDDEPLKSELMAKNCVIRLNSEETDLALANRVDRKVFKTLENEVEEKRKLVEDLKQAEIYKKLHNVGELKQLTATWKQGCVSALNDLLVLHKKTMNSNVDMATLLANFNVPNNLVTLSPNGDLI